MPLIASAQAQATFSHFFGELNCAEYVEAAERYQEKNEYDRYISGFLSGANLARARVTPNSFAGYRVWVKKYCEQNPFATFSNALISLDASLCRGTFRLKKND